MSCEKENEDLSSDFSISGYAQKGQFIKGATITAYALNDKLLATGESFPSVIKDDLGSFAISAEVTAPYLELKAEGYYFIENTGETSTSPIYLNALASSSQEKININLLTTLTSGRIKKLINEGKSFEVAKKQAERELINIFSFQPESVTLGFEEMKPLVSRIHAAQSQVQNRAQVQASEDPHVLHQIRMNLVRVGLTELVMQRVDRKLA